MTDHGIIFSGPMVQALRARRKTQTRRLATSPLAHVQPGDRLWVRETWAVASIFTDVVEVRYQASQRAGHTEFIEQIPVGRAASAKVTWPKWRPSIHMPRWASRMALIVTEVRVQPLQAIDARDAIAEGIPSAWGDFLGEPPAWALKPGEDDSCFYDNRPSIQNYGRLWDHLHGDGAWNTNPEIVALTFTVEHRNIDMIARAA